MKEKEIKQIAKKNFKKWNQALLSNDCHRVADIYNDEATFLPTMSPKFKIGKKEAKEYFEHFLQGHPKGKIVKEKVQIINENCYLHSGLYNFEVDDEGRKRKIVEARFTFIWEKTSILGVWKIIHHHSSLRPS